MSSVGLSDAVSIAAPAIRDAVSLPTAPASSRATREGGRTVEADCGQARLSVLPADPSAPLVLWIRDAGSGQVPVGTGSTIAVLDLTLDWPADADDAMLGRQVVTAVRSALVVAGSEYSDFHNGAVVVGGHSFGATLALFALAHLPELSAAIAHSGCYNRTLTPTGFQHEKRDYWTARDVYEAFSAFHFANALDRPLLIVHGAEDMNPATTPDQAVDFYRCIVAAGGRARLVVLPHEGHTFRYREVCEALAAEHRSWLNQWR
jgi:pimeloyl-ACP methyl ester carboxylesterase